MDNGLILNWNEMMICIVTYKNDNQMAERRYMVSYILFIIGSESYSSHTQHQAFF